MKITRIPRVASRRRRNLSFLRLSFEKLPTASRLLRFADHLPISFTSGFKTTPNCALTSARASSISRRTSSALAPPRLTMKLPCFGEICARPICFASGSLD